MAFSGIYRLQDPPLSGDIVTRAQQKAVRAFGSYAIPLGVTVNGLYDAPTAAFVAEFQERKEVSGYLPLLPANPNAQRGDLDAATKEALGIVPAAVVPGSAAQPYVGYSLAGTGGTWSVGPHFMAISRYPEKVYAQGVFYNTSAFLLPDPNHSYVEARDEGCAEALRLMLPDYRKKFIAGYSMGADVVVRVLHAWPADRRHEIVGVFTFGSPGRPPGPTKFGTDHGGAGISGVYTPAWARDREWSYDISGDMYPEATGLLPQMYELLTRMELSTSFMKYLFTWLTGVPLDVGSLFTHAQAPPSALGAGLLGLAGSKEPGSAPPGFGALAPILGLITPGPIATVGGLVSLPAMLMNLPAIIAALAQALKFIFTGAHGKYWTDPIFEGLTAEDHAASMVRKLAV